MGRAYPRPAATLDQPAELVPAGQRRDRRDALANILVQHDRRCVRKPAPDVAGAAAATGNRRMEHVLPIIGILRRHDPAPINLATATVFMRRTLRACSTFVR